LEQAVGDGFARESVLFDLLFDERLQEGIRVEVTTGLAVFVVGATVVRAGAIDALDAGQDGGSLKRRMKLDAEGTGSVATFARLNVGRLGAGAGGRGLVVRSGGVVGVCRWLWVVADGTGDGLEQVAESFLSSDLDGEVAGCIEEFGEVAAHMRNESADDLVGSDLGVADALANALLDLLTAKYLIGGLIGAGRCITG
jgi:hypothetical protein